MCAHDTEEIAVWPIRLANYVMKWSTKSTQPDKRSENNLTDGSEIVTHYYMWSFRY